MRFPRLTRRTAALAVAVAFGSCALRSGVYHRVGPGQTVRRIAAGYGVPAETIVSANGLPGAGALRPGSEIWIPGARSRAPRIPSFEEFRDLVLRPYLRGGLAWPVAGTVSSGFGGRRGGRHKGLDILAPEGTPVRAARQGLVIYCGDGLRGYGNAVVIDHGEGVTTLYGHLREFRVESGDAVPAAAVIGTVGRSGNATAPHLHFELRVEDEAVDPLRYLENGAAEDE